MKPFAVIAALSVLAASPALAQESRYVMEKTDTGFVRMDTVTGAMSVCETNGKQLVCRLAADERHAFQDAIDELHERIDALETKVAALSGDGVRPGVSGLPNDEEMEETFSFMEKFFRRFMGIAKDLEREFGGSDPEPLPDRT